MLDISSVPTETFSVNVVEALGRGVYMQVGRVVGQEFCTRQTRKLASQSQCFAFAPIRAAGTSVERRTHLAALIKHGGGRQEVSLSYFHYCSQTPIH